MDRLRQKVKKEKPLKHVDKDNSPSFISDVKSIKENLKIKEILRTVKMNSSMRVKAPRGSKVMNNKDFNDTDDLFNDDQNVKSLEQQSAEPPSATNPDVIITTVEDANNCNIETENLPENHNVDTDTCNVQSIESTDVSETTKNCNDVPNYMEHMNTVSNDQIHNSVTGNLMSSEIQFLVDNSHLKTRDRKLSLDHTLLTRREGLSQSELDLHSIGKSPLERKSSFFRKKMDSFFKNTSEIFKRQSLGSKPQPVQRRGSMSLSLQSLNEKSGDYNAMIKTSQGSMISLQSSSTVGSLGRSTSSLSGAGVAAGPCAAPHDAASDVANSQPALSSSQPIGDISSESITSLNQAYIEDSLLSARAISMSSGLDSAHATRSRKSSNRSNRVSWVASEGLTNYFRRIIQDEKSKETQVYHSYSDFTTIPENGLCGPRLDSKGRRLSYQRAVSGEDPVVQAPRYPDSGRRRHLIPENSEANYELSNLLADFTRNGVPPLKGFVVANISEEAFSFLHWAEHPQNLHDFHDFKTNPKLKLDFPQNLSQEEWDYLESILLWEQAVFWKTKYSPGEEARQTVLRELVNTEAVHIRHLISIVEVFIAAAHALQDAGKLLDVDTERLFSNIPDVLNASLYFWEITIYPMLADAFENCSTFNAEFMSAGFCRFREIFAPYEKFVCQQTKALDYLRSLSNNTDFMMYLTWCHSQKECKRLQLVDILVKPMQRLTKYGLILRRIIAYTDIEPERTALIAMETFAKNHVLDLNRTIRQREELEKLDALANSVESYEVDFKDEDIDRYFKMFTQLNLKAPMINCVPTHSRTIIYEGDVRFKDQHKEMEVRAILLTDMLLICKKQSKGLPYKMIRPKYMVDKMYHFSKVHPKNPKELISLSFVVVDEVGSSAQAFMFTETSKDQSSHGNLKLWETKFREARLTYDLGVWFFKNPSRDLSEVEMDSSSEYAASSGNKPGVKQSSDDLNIERDARERVATMLHRNMGTSTEHDYSQASMTTDSFDAAGDASGGGASGKTPGLHNLRHPMHRTSTGGSSRQSRLSSFQQSTSAASHDEPQPGTSKNLYLAGSSVEHVIPPMNPDDTVTSITVNVVSESESETVVSSQQQSPQRAGSRSPSSSNMLRVQPAGGVVALVHSLPDLTVDPSPPRPLHGRLPRNPWALFRQSHVTLRVPPRSGVLALVLSLPNLTVDVSLPLRDLSPSPQSASEMLYQSHQELLQRNRLTAASSQHHQYLTPGHRGTSYPPPSPTRASLKRSLAFSYSFKNPPLSKMGHVNSQSALNAEAGPSASQQVKIPERAATAPPTPIPGTSSDKGEKKSKQFISRNKGGSSRSSSSPGRKDKEDQKGD